MRREHNIQETTDEWDLIIDMPLDGNITNLTGLYTQSGSPSSWVTDPSDSTRQVACFNSKGPVIYPDDNYDLKQSVYFNKVKMSLDFYKLNYTSGSHPNLLDSSYGGGTGNNAGTGFFSQCLYKNTWYFGLNRCNLTVSKNSIPVNIWFNWTVDFYDNNVDIIITRISDNTIIAEKHEIVDISSWSTVIDKAKTQLKLGANNQWSDNRTSYAYLRNFKMWLHK